LVAHPIEPLAQLIPNRPFLFLAQLMALLWRQASLTRYLLNAVDLLDQSQSFGGKTNAPALLRGVRLSSFIKLPPRVGEASNVDDAIPFGDAPVAVVAVGLQKPVVIGEEPERHGAGS
jgi:hypothetical protein